MKASIGKKPSEGEGSPSSELLEKRHLLVGWWSLLIFLTLGLALELLHGFKIGAYLNVSNETRRLLWTLAHAHGTLLGLVNLAFCATLRMLPDWPAHSRKLASGFLLSATLLMPAGFFLGGVRVYGGDPGPTILLVPAGGLLLLVSVLMTALRASSCRQR
ncbi:MAG: hypothetical protein JWN25_1435 [Verrucomicrobiales bacterium]|nr:hypothetical protein [Verrucomicrobiales bacterium]MDB6131213.1 hypothetical protein [Verrucomicrobiales bacterium]